MENRLTDEQIIKAFEHLTKNAGNHISVTGKMLLEDVLGVLNRQKAEIERLNEKYSRMRFNLESVLAERADHTEAIKEFTSRIERVLSLHPAQAKYYYEIKKEYIKEEKN